MDLFGILGTALRRWYIALPIVLLGAVFAYQSYLGVQSVYAASSTIVILPPQSTGGGDDEEDSGPSNPFSGSGGPRFAAAVLARNVNSTAFEQRLDPAVMEGSTYEADPSEQQPMIRMDVTSESPESVAVVMEAVIAEANVVLNEFQEQAGALPETRYRSAVAVPTGTVEDITPSRFRTAGAIAALAGIAGVAAALVFDALMARRSSRRDPAGATVGDDEWIERGADAPVIRSRKRVRAKRDRARTGRSGGRAAGARAASATGTVPDDDSAAPRDSASPEHSSERPHDSAKRLARRPSAHQQGRSPKPIESPADLEADTEVMRVVDDQPRGVAGAGSDAGRESGLSAGAEVHSGARIGGERARSSSRRTDTDT